jgi:hypothetical protein
MKRPKQIFAEHTGLQDDVLDQAWSDWLADSLTTGISWSAWWADNQGRYV